jgi:hypothetical protein
MLTDLLKERLSALDDLLLQAIREVFNEQVEREFNFIRPEDTNALIGEKFRACEVSKRIINQSFNEIELYRGGRVKTKKFNKEL